MTFTVIRVQLLKLWNSKPQLLLTFFVPVLFFSIFALIFGKGLKGSAPGSLKIAIVDEDRSDLSRAVIADLAQDEALVVRTIGGAKIGSEASSDDKEAEQTVPLEQAEEWIRSAGIVVAVQIPAGFEAAEDDAPEGRVRLLADLSDQIAPRLVAAAVQRSVGRHRVEAVIARARAAAILRRLLARSPRDDQPREEQQGHGDAQGSVHNAPQSGPPDESESAGSPPQSPFDGPVFPPWYVVPGQSTGGEGNDLTTALGSVVTPEAEQAGAVAQVGEAQVDTIDFFGGSKQNPIVAMYAAGIAVMFLLFSANNAGEALLIEQETGTLERMLTSRLGLNRMMLGKWLWMLLLGTTQTTVMFLWAQAVFQVDLWGHLEGFAVMTLATSAASASFALFLATLCRTRSQLQAVSVVLILSMSALGGSMVPRYVMSDELQSVGLATFNAWALDGFNKVFWRDLPISSLGPQVVVLAGVTLVLGLTARLLARRWEQD
jgi:ABC-2 type transport system permease protein